MIRRLRKRWLVGAGVFGVGLVLLAYFGLALVAVQAALQPDRWPFEAQPSDYGLASQDVTFNPRGDSSLTLRGWLLPGSADAPYLIFIHGRGGQRTSDGALDLASRLVHSGYNVLVFDLRGQGTSDGDRITGGYFERDDVLGAYDFLLTRGAQPGRVGLVGRSMGAGIAIMAAAEEPGVSAVVADSPYADVDDVIADETARDTPAPKWLVPIFLPPARLIADHLYGIDLEALVPERDVERLAFPIYIVHGEADTRIPVSQAYEVLDHAPRGSQLWTLPGVDHVGAFRARPDEYTQRVLAYLDGRFAAPPSARSSP